MQHAYQVYDNDSSYMYSYDTSTGLVLASIASSQLVVLVLACRQLASTTDQLYQIGISYIYYILLQILDTSIHQLYNYIYIYIYMADISQLLYISTYNMHSIQVLCTISYVLCSTYSTSYIYVLYLFIVYRFIQYIQLHSTQYIVYSIQYTYSYSQYQYYMYILLSIITIIQVICNNNM